MPKYIVSGRISGDWTTIIDAESLEDAREKAERMLDDDATCPDIDNVDDATVDYVQEIKDSSK